MGIINCKSNTRYLEESKSEVDITQAFNKLQRTQEIYQSMTNRVFSDKEKLLRGVQSNFATYPKNFDPYYSFLLEQLKCSTSSTAATPSKSGKENASSAKRAAKSTRCSASSNKLANATNTYLHTECRNSSVKNEQFVPKISCSLRNRNRNRNFNRQAVLTYNPNKKFNFDIISLLPHNIQAIIVNYLINQYRSLLCISAVWHSNIIFTFDMVFNPIENSLIEKLGKSFAFKNSFTQSAVCNTGGLRVDRIIQLEVLKGLGKTIEISYTYSFTNDSKNVYRTQYKVDCVKGSRTLWIHRSENILTGRQCTYNMNIGQVAEGDVIEIAINYYTPRGLINANSVKWDEIVLANTIGTNKVSKESVLSEEAAKRSIDLNRTCELETMGSEWYDSKYYKMSKQFFNLHPLLQLFAVASIEFTELDIKAFKVTLSACRTGNVEKWVVGVPLVVKSRGRECTVQVKRLGLMIDREGELELRIGDTLILYLSKHKHE